MKFRAIRLNNVRRFTAPVEIRDIGPGLNVLSAPNEQGKSTIFDALQALFFKDAKSWDKEVRSLAPHAGGDPEISATIDLGGAVYEISKTFTKSAGKGEVKVLKNGHLFQQADGAEAWLAEVLKTPKDGGPAGLLWVRQGLAPFQDAKDTFAARRDLLSSVTGEVEAITGGRQMEQLRDQVRAELDRYLTRTGMPKTGGPLKEADAQLAKLGDQVDDLTGKVAELKGHFDERRGLSQELAQLRDLDAAKARKARLEAARAALAKAETHSEKLSQANVAVHEAETRLDGQRHRIETLEARRKEFSDASAARAEAETAFQRTQESRAKSEIVLTKVSQADELARATLATARADLDGALRSEAALQGVLRRKDLSTRLKQAQDLQGRISAQSVTAGQGPSDAEIEALELAWGELSLARRTREATAAAVSVSYLPGSKGRVHLDNVALVADTRFALPDGGDLEIDGIGVVHVHPASHDSADALGKAQCVFDDALATAKATDLETARKAHRDRNNSRQDLSDAKRALQLVAPDGVDALRQELGALPSQTDLAQDVPDRATAEQSHASAKQAHDQGLVALEGARTQHEGVSTTAKVAAATRDGARDRLERATVAQGDAQKSDADLQVLQNSLAALDLAQTKAQSTLDSLMRETVDLELVKVAFERAKSVMDQSDARTQIIAQRLAALEALIGNLASLGVAEELSEATGKLQSAKALREQIQFEVDVLTRLDVALERARNEARDQYIGPVLRELEPLVRMIWPEAKVQMDAEAMLPSHLLRPGVEDSFEQLSGGAQEQVALLVRLAFARMLSHAGTPAPVILDDAIVFTDDARIEMIFDALTRQASDLQIIVFTCRQKVFRDLGGRLLSITPQENSDSI